MQKKFVLNQTVNSWSDGAELGEVLGLESDQLVHIDEPGATVTAEQLAELLPSLVPERLDDLLRTGLIEACGLECYCVPSPSLLQLTVDAIAAGYDPDRVLALIATIREATAVIADAAIDLLADRPTHSDPARLMALAARGRGLLSHGTGRLTIYAVGRRLGIAHAADTKEALRRLLGADA